MVDRVVVGYDTSPESAAAVRWAATYAAARGWDLDVVHVWGFAGQEGGGAGTSWLGQQVRAQVADVAEEGAAVAREGPRVPADAVHAHVAHGRPALVLADLAADARLVVVGRRGAGGRLNALLGSVTTGVLHRSRCPVAVVPVDGPHLPGMGGEPVLVGFDGSPGSFGALEAGYDHAARAGVPLSALTAWSTVDQSASPGYWLLGYPGRSPAEVALDEAERVLERARSWSAARHDVEVGLEVVEGRPAQVLERRSRHAGLVVVGTRGRGGFASLALGSTSRSVVQRAHCPVLVTRTATGVAEEEPPQRARAAASV
ncbi:universal stress protein [Cellulomonas triticagri]|nr:universal stress protein [Cellulomonas triticagri]